MARFRTTIVLGILVAVLGVLAVVAESMNRRVSERGNRKFFEFKREDVVLIEVKYPGDGRPTVRVERAGEGWKMLEPFPGDADRQTVERVIAYLSTLEGTAHWSESDEEIAKLATDRIVVEVKCLEGEVHWAKLGELAGSEFRGFARVSAADGIWEVSKGIWDAADHMAVDFRDRRLFTVDYFDVEELELERGKKTTRVYKEGEEWFMSSPFEDRGQEVQIFEFLSEIVKSRVEEFVTEEASSEALIRYGLDPPAAVVRLGGKGKKSIVAFGKVTSPEAEKGVWYAKRSDRPFIGRVDPKVASKVESEDPYLFRGRLLVPDPRTWQPSEIFIEGNVEGRAVRFRVKRGQFKRWTLAEPREIVLDQSSDGMWGMFLKKIVGLSAEEFFDEDPPAEELEKKYGLGAGAVRFDLTFQKIQRQRTPQAPGAIPKRKLTVWLGGRDEALEVVYARVEGRKNVVGVHEEVLHDLTRGYVRFLNRDLNPINEGEVLWVEFTHKGKTARWERKGSRWLLVKPEKGGGAKSMRMQAALAGQDLVRANAYLKEVDDPRALPKAWGLHPPVSILKICQRIRGPIPKETKELHFGRQKDNESMYARFKKGDFQLGDLAFLMGRSAYEIFLSFWKEAYPPQEKGGEKGEKKDEGNGEDGERK